MRTIKFRAWDKVAKEMLDMVTVACEREVHWPPLYVKGGIIDGIDHQDYVLMQYTGLRDSKRTKEYPNGQEIYEGDIVRCYGGAYLNGAYEYDYITEVRDIRDLGGIIRPGNVEILGNKYENPELLKRVRMEEMDDKERLEEIETKGGLTRQVKAMETILYNDKMNNDVKAGLLKVQRRIINGYLDDIINQHREETK